MTTRRRCAIYTRKSTEEGLEQDFNSLHAQREACEAFIRSQRHEGWQVLPEAYDDGGYSGGTMDRPALSRLLEAAQSGTVDVIVVYKVDRLTRSLVDFARMVELFDANGLSFVCVTQQFNTTTSMGRLTLNVLLSFAQFEREVTGERIRDKIAASKKKGLWMGGLVPLGYDLKNRTLVINEPEAETVRTLFRLYLELETVRRLKEEADRRGLVTKRRPQATGAITGGASFTRGHLYQLLSNPLYAGEVRHKGATYPGQHPAIVDRETFAAVQQRLAQNATNRHSPTNAKVPSLLTGLVYDETGDLLCPTHANKKGTRYRYYISKRLMHPSDPSSGGWRLPAKELEGVVLRGIVGLLKDDLRLSEALQMKDTSADRSHEVMKQAAALAGDLLQGSPQRQRQLLAGLLSCLVLQAAAISVEIRLASLLDLLDPQRSCLELGANGALNFLIPIELKRRGVESKLVMQVSSGSPTPRDAKLVSLLADAHRWIDDLGQGRAVSLRDLARQYNRDVGEVSRTLPIAFLAPDIVAAILHGRQAIELTPRQLLRIGTMPHRWDDQRRRLGCQYS
jgi:DNA invertase Pin-like site-specific DNA recombinase